MLQVGNAGMNPEEDKSHFSLWAILAAPLFAGNDIRRMKPGVSAILLNREVIAIDQDPRGRAGTRIKKDGSSEVWARPLADGGFAVVLFNRGSLAVRIAIDWSSLGLSSQQTAQVRDLWKREEIGAFKKEYADTVAAHGVVMIKVSVANKDERKQ